MRTKRRSPGILIYLAIFFCCPGSLLAENKFLDDLFLGVWSPFTAKWETSIPVCVWTETADSLYKVTVTGQQPGTQYFVTNDVGDKATYRVFWYFGQNLKQKERLRSGVLSRRNFPFSDNRLCTNGPSARITVRLNKKQISEAPPGIYNDTLLLMFSPL